jgi:hypothetical protein
MHGGWIGISSWRSNANSSKRVDVATLLLFKTTWSTSMEETRHEINPDAPMQRHIITLRRAHLCSNAKAQKNPEKGD